MPPDGPPSSGVCQAQQLAKESRCPSGYKAAKIALARKATHYLSGIHVQVTAGADLMADFILRRPEGQTMEWHESMRLFTERLAQRLNEGSI